LATETKRDAQLMMSLTV